MASDELAAASGNAAELSPVEESEPVADPLDPRFRAMIEHSSDAVVLFTGGGIVLYASPSTERVLGYHPSSFVGRSALTIIPAEERGVAAAELARLIERPGETIVVEYSYRHRDGSRRWLETTATNHLHEPSIGAIVANVRDITERKLAEQERERHLREREALLDSAAEGIFGMDADGNCTFINRAALALLGFTSEECLGQDMHTLIHHSRPDGSPYPIEECPINTAFLEGRSLYRIEETLWRKDGTSFPALYSVSSTVEHGIATGGVVTIVDIADRKRAEERLRFLAQASSVLVGSLDAETTLTRLAGLIVPRLADWCIVHLAEPDGALRQVTVAHVDPVKRAQAETVALRYPVTPDAPTGPARVVRIGQAEFVAEIGDELLTASARDAEHLRLLREAGMRSYLSVPLMARGRMLGAITLLLAESARRYDAEDLGFAEDLARRVAMAIDNARLYAEAHAAEIRYRSLFEGVADGIVVCDGELRFLDANVAATDLLGYSCDELRQMRVHDIALGGEEWVAAQVERFRAEGRWQDEFEIVRKDGSTLPVDAIVTPVDLPTGRVYLGAWRDISERRALSRLQEDFIAMVSHDLRSPLAVLKGHAQLMRRRGVFNPQGIEAILGQVQRMERLVANLSDAVRLEAGGIDLDCLPFDLVGLAAEHVEQAQSQTPRHLIRLDAPPAPVTGSWDRDRLGQVLQNLLGNAVKYSPDGGDVTVRIGVDGDDVQLSVTDQGVGIAPDALPHLFDRFYRANARGAAGWGLGLYISRMLVEAHGGHIAVDSTPGQGSTFTVLLPL